MFFDLNFLICSSIKLIPEDLEIINRCNFCIYLEQTLIHLFFVQFISILYQPTKDCFLFIENCIIYAKVKDLINVKGAFLNFET